MNRQLSVQEVEELFQSTVREPLMSRQEKLLHWANLVRNCRYALYIFHSLERWSKDELEAAHDPASAFAIAAADPKFKAAGLQDDRVSTAMRFFELTQSQLHEFSCDCGGAITPCDMARRIEFLAY